MTECEEAQHLTLAIGEWILLGTPLGLGLCGDEARPKLRMHVTPAGGHFADRSDNLRIGGLLQNVAARTRSERLPDVLRVVLHGEHEHSRFRMLVQERRQDIEPALIGHDDVEQDYVRLRRARLEDRIARATRFPHSLEIVFRIDQEA